MSTVITPSDACCNTPVAVVKDYTPKGTYIDVEGLNTYTTGPASAKFGLLLIPDIFGFFPQTLQGADILAYEDKGHEYQVFIPDFFEGSPADISWYPPDTKEKGEKLGAWFKGPGLPQTAVERVPKIVKGLSDKYTDITAWAVLGFCWGGKITNLVSQKDTPFKAAAACHPAMVDAADAPKIEIPICLLPSKDESKEDVDKYEKALTVKHQIKWYPNQIHGWMAARGDLSDPEVKKGYEDGYQTVMQWFRMNLP